MWEAWLVYHLTVDAADIFNHVLPGVQMDHGPRFPGTNVFPHVGELTPNF